MAGYWPSSFLACLWTDMAAIVRALLLAAERALLSFKI